MGILATFVCDYPECNALSEPMRTYEIDTYSWHDAPADGFTAIPPEGWLHDTLYNWIACPQHQAEMLADRANYPT